MGISQIVAGIAAAGVAKGLVPSHQVLFDVRLGKDTSITQGLFLEMFVTAQLLLAVFLLAAEVGFLVSPSSASILM
jgi:aquaporin related protein